MVICAQKLAKDAGLMEVVCSKSIEPSVSQLIGKVEAMNQGGCFHGDIKLSEIYYSRNFSKHFLVNPRWETLGVKRNVDPKQPEDTLP